MHVNAVLADQDGCAFAKTLFDEMRGRDDLQLSLQSVGIHDLADLYRFHPYTSLFQKKDALRILFNMLRT